MARQPPPAASPMRGVPPAPVAPQGREMAPGRHGDERPRGDDRPHVDHDARWVGHESGPHDTRYRVEQPWGRGRFRQPIGRGHLYRIEGWDAPRRRFWFSNSYFIVAEPDFAYADDWDWARDQVVLYDDPDHPGWYLAYNVRLETYVHVQYDGAM